MALRKHSIIKIVILRFMTLIYNTNNESPPWYKAFCEQPGVVQLSKEFPIVMVPTIYHIFHTLHCTLFWVIFIPSSRESPTSYYNSLLLLLNRAFLPPTDVWPVSFSSRHVLNLLHTYHSPVTNPSQHFACFVSRVGHRLLPVQLTIRCHSYIHCLLYEYFIIWNNIRVWVL